MNRSKPRRSRYEKLMADLLFMKIRDSGRSLRDLSRALERDPDDIARILKGYKKFEIGLVYEVLAELDLPPEGFFEQYHRLLPFEAEPEDHEFVPLKNRRISRKRLLKTMESTLEEVLARTIAKLENEPAEATEPAQPAKPAPAVGAEPEPPTRGKESKKGTKRAATKKKPAPSELHRGNGTE